MLGKMRKDVEIAQMVFGAEVDQGYAERYRAKRSQAGGELPFFAEKRP